MKKRGKLGSIIYIAICFAFFYIPIIVTMVFSFNSSKSLTRFTGFSLKWYQALVEDRNIMLSLIHI